MAVIVNDGMSIELVLRMLWREANRELIIDKLKENRYYIKPTTKRHEVKKVHAKTVRRRASARRKFRNRGWLLA